jgi:ubiquinone biosynthesis protein UbiJ
MPLLSETRILDGMESAINGLLAYDPDTRAALAEIAGTLIAVEIAGFAPIYIAPQAEAVRLSRRVDRTADVQIAGSAADLLAMARRPTPGPAAVAPGEDTVTLTGNLGLARRLEAILRHIDIDWEEMLAQRIGDIGARQIAHLGRAMARQARTARASLEADLGEYLVVEKEAVVGPAQLDTLADDVDTLRADVDRLEARIRLLAARLGARPPGAGR